MACYISIHMQVFDIDADLLPNTDPETCGAGMRGLKFDRQMQIHALDQEQAKLVVRAVEGYLKQVCYESPDALTACETLRQMAGEEDPESMEISVGVGDGLPDPGSCGGSR
jgi:hypothetical protein